MRDPEVLSNEEIAELLPHLATIKSWCDSVARHAEKLALSGVPIEGYKLVSSRTNRRWSDDEEAIKGHDPSDQRAGDEPETHFSKQGSSHARERLRQRERADRET